MEPTPLMTNLVGILCDAEIAHGNKIMIPEGNDQTLYHDVAYALITSERRIYLVSSASIEMTGPILQALKLAKYSEVHKDDYSGCELYPISGIHVVLGDKNIQVNMLNELFSTYGQPGDYIRGPSAPPSCDVIMDTYPGINMTRINRRDPKVILDTLEQFL